MTLNKHFTYGFEDRHEPKLWLCKPNKQRIERLASFTKLSGTFKYTNLNQLTFQLPLMEFNEETKQVERNKSIDMVKSKYLIEYRYNGFKDYLVIDDIKKTSNDSDYITIVADSLASELNKKSANEIELLGSTLAQMNNKIFEVYAPLWKLGYVDPKLADVKRELTSSNTTANALIDQICSLFDAVAIYNNIDRVVDYYHKDNVGTNRGLRVRENSYLKSFEDQFVSKDIVTRLYPFGNNGLTIQGVNPAGSSYIEDFSFFMAPFKRDINKNVIEHSAYMSDELCHALLDYQEFYNSKKEIAEEMTKSYSDILKEHSTEDFKLNQLSAILTRQRERVELLKPKSEYIDLGNKETDFEITTAKSSYYLLMLRNDGNLDRIKFNNQEYDIKSGEWLYIKIDTGDFEDATKFENKLKYKLEMKSTNTNLRVVYTRSSLTDYEEEDTKVIEEKYNYEKYKKLVEDQEKIVASIEKRIKLMEDQKSSLITSMNPKSFLTDDLYKERELYVFESIWTEENHTEAKDLYEDAIKEMKKQKEINRTITIDLVNFVQSIDHQYDWDKLNVGDKIVFSNKMFGEKLKAYITELQLNFDDNGVKVVISDVFDYKDLDTIIAEKLAQTSSTASQVNFQKEQIKDQTGKMTKMTELIEAEWDANKRRIMAGNETVDIGSHGVKVTSKENPNEYVIMVGGVIAMTRDGGETFKTGITPEGINAEMLLGKMIVGETLTLENESGTMRFDKDGLFINTSDFHLTSNDGKENYFDKLKREIQDNTKQETDRIVDSFRNEINQTISEATDIEKIVNDTTNILNDAFQDGVITNVEKKLIKDSLSTLEKENQEYQDKIDLALNHPYITPQDTIDLNEAIVEYESMYESLTTSIIESISDSKVTAEESERVNQSIVNFREEVKEILSLTQTIIERTKDQQLKSEVEKAIDYSNRVKEDIKDEMDDLKKSFNGLNETIEEAMQDNIFDAAEIEAIKTVVLLAKSEYQDIENRYNTIKNDTKLPKAEKDKLVSNYTELNSKFLDFTKYIDAMIADGKSDDTEKTNYKAKYNALTNATTEFKKQYDASVIAISKQYTNDETGKILGSFDSLSNELKNDLKDVQDNIIEFKSTTVAAFQDGIVTEAERTRLRVQLDMLDRESLDVEERYNSILNHQYANSEIKNSISVKRSPYIAAHSNLRIIIERVIADGKVTTAEKTEANNAITTYNNTLTAYSKAIQEALNSMSKVIAADIAQTNVSQFSGVLSDISASIQDIQKQADGAIDTYYLNGVPTLTNEPASAWTTTKVKDSHLGDLYLNNKTGVAYRFLKENNTYVWKEIADQVISDALRQSKNAQDTADGKRRVFVNTPKPPYDTGDMWVQGTSGDILVCNISKETGGIYSSNDWIKASKYTDDTIANKALTDLNTFKTTANQDISSLKTKTSNFERDIVNAFDDKVISIAEASSIKGQLALLDHEKNRITQQYQTLINNSALEGSPKTNLTSTYSLMNTKMNNLTSAIQSSIADNKIVISESNDVSSKFSEYKVAVSNYEIAVNNAINAVIQKIATTSADAATARFEEWKRSEFSQSSEQIAQRVSGSSWTSQISPALQNINNKLDNIQIGGRNLLENSASIIKTIDQTTGNYNQYFNIYINEVHKKVKKGDVITISFDIQMERGDYFIIYDSNQNFDFAFGAAKFNNIGNKKQRLSATFTLGEATKASENWQLAFYNNNNGDRFTIENIKIEKGNKATDWSPAPEDFDTKLDNITIGGKNILKGTKDYDTSYWNGIFSEKFNKDGRTFVPLQNKTNTSGSQQWIHQTFKTDPYTDYIISFDAYKEGTAKGDIYPQMRKLKDDATDFNPFISIFAYNEKNKSLTNNIVRYSVPFKSEECNYMRFYITRESTSSAPIYIANIQIEKGNKTSDWSPNPDEIQETLNQHNSTITANNAFIETNKDKILNSVSRTDVQAQLDKIATYETSYTVSNGSNISSRLAENNGNFFNDNYSYEVVAKNNSLSQDNIATAIFVSKGVGKGFELVELENISKTGTHPKFIIDKSNPSISIYDAQTVNQNISVIYTKYLGSASSIKTSKSMIEQKADEINLEVKRLTAETEYNNMLINSDFSSGWEGWMSQDSNYSIAPKSEMSINTDDNLISNGSYRNDYVGGSTSKYRRVVFKLLEPLIVGHTYTIAFDMLVTRGDNNGKITIYPYTPSATAVTVNVDSNQRNVYTFKATQPSTEILLYSAPSGTDENTNTDVTFSKVTCIEGSIPLDYTIGSSKNVIKMQYTTSASWPSVISNFMTVGKGQEVAIGEELTFSTYLYIPSSSKGHINGFIYFELANYENKNQTTNGTIGNRIEIYPKDIVYDKWTRYSYTVTVPESTEKNGKTNYIRALLRMGAATSGQSVDKDAVFYYGLPQLEKGKVATKWTTSKLDTLSTEGLASKIALNPESIDIITRNINFNTDTISIRNTNGNFLITGDSISVSNNDNSNKTTINSNGISIKKDGVDKFINGLDLGSTNVQPTLPMAKTWNLVTGSAGNNSYNNKPVVSESPWGSFLLERDAYKYAIDNKQGEEASGTDKVNVAQFSYYHEKRYLRMDYQAAATEGNNFYITVVERPGWKTNSSIKVYQEIKVAGTKRGTVPIRSIYFDLGKPVYMFNTFYIQLAISGTTGLGQGAELQILRMSLTDYNN